MIDHRKETPASLMSHSNYIEILNPNLNTSHIRHALFDFDGTISVMREGWPDVMIPLMVEILLDTPNNEGKDALEEYCREYVDQSTGIDTIYQMMHIAEQVEARGGIPLEPMDYKKEYLRRLMLRIAHRIDSVKSGEVKPKDMVMEGSLEFVELLESKGIKMYVASGTDHANVVDEANALGVAHYFGEHIYGALDNYLERSKAKVIQSILETNNLSGDSLMVLGDGFVEIENCKAVGGIAIGVASDEVNRRGWNDWKRERLTRAGADVIIPDFSDIPALEKLLFGE